MSANNGLRDFPRLTQSSVRQAVSSAVAAHRNGWSDQEMADEWGVSAGTVNNAQNKKHDLALFNWLMLGQHFGPEALTTTLALIGMKAVAAEAVMIDIGKVPFDVSSALPLLIELLTDGTCCASDMRRLEDAGVVDKIIEIAEFLRNRRSQVRLEAV